jgi:hypothetical protein
MLGSVSSPTFLAISLNNRVVAVFDTKPADSGDAVSVF